MVSTWSMNVEDMIDKMDDDGEYELTSETLWIDMDDEELGVRSEFNYTYDGNKIILDSQVNGDVHPCTGAVLVKK